MAGNLPGAMLRKRPILICLAFSSILLFIVICIRAVKPIPCRREFHDSSVINRSDIFGTDRISSPRDFEEESDVPCTFQLLRSYFAKHRSFGAGGKWYLDHEPPYYQPSFCKFKFRRIPINKVTKCLSDANVNSIMTIGDSNGQKNFNGLQTFLPKCKTTLRELMVDKFFPKTEYFVANRTDEAWTKFLEVHYRLCGTCKGTRMECPLSSTQESPAKKVYLEHIPMTMVVDDSMRIHIPRITVVAPMLSKFWAPTTQEFTFRYYLKDRYPDVFIVFLPFNHAKHLLLDRLAIDIGYFQSLARHYFPEKTKFVYLPAFAEFEKARTGVQWINKTFENMLASEKIEKMNRAMYSVLENDFLDPKSHHYGFFDLMEMSKSVGFWSQDGIHMKGVWYNTVMSMFWETFCNSVQMNAF